MSVTILKGDRDLPLAGLHRRTIAILGYGNQGRAHALNLRDTGASLPDDQRFTLVIGTRHASAGAARAERDGFHPRSLDEAVQISDLVIIALPDEVQADVYCEHIGPNLREGVTIGFLHGFAIHYGHIQPREDVGIVLVAPKGPGRTLRDRYRMGQGIPALLCVEQESARDDARSIALAWANGIGAARAGVIETSFANETETDLFGEQAVLCGGLMTLVRAAVRTLIEAGYPPELAYLEACHEVKQVADLLYQYGPAGMAGRISNTAEFGMYAACESELDQLARSWMKRVLAEITDGRFAGRIAADHAQNNAWLNACRTSWKQDDIESAGAVIRSLMPWLSSSEGEAPNGEPDADQ